MSTNRNDNRIYPVRALREFARSKPWQGTVDERKKKFRALHAGFCEAYEQEIALQFAHVGRGDTSAMSRMMRPPFADRPTLVMHGKLSVLTFLYLWGQFVSPRSRQAGMDWAHQCFTRFFPRSAARLTFQDGLFRVGS